MRILAATPALDLYVSSNAILRDFDFISKGMLSLMSERPSDINLVFRLR
jgi:hypothetical protein